MNEWVRKSSERHNGCSNQMALVSVNILINKAKLYPFLRVTTPSHLRDVLVFCLSDKIKKISANLRACIPFLYSFLSVKLREGVHPAPGFS